MIYNNDWEIALFYTCTYYYNEFSFYDQYTFKVKWIKIFIKKKVTD